MTTKATHAEVNYRPGMASRRCGLCKKFVAPDACSGVQSPIRSSALCDRFVRKMYDSSKMEN